LLKTGNLGRENVKSETTKTKVKYSKWAFSPNSLRNGIILNKKCQTCHLIISANLLMCEWILCMCFFYYSWFSNGGIKWGIVKRHTKLLNSSIRIKMREILLMIVHLALGGGGGGNWLAWNYECYGFAKWFQYFSKSKLLKSINCRRFIENSNFFPLN
jgi:hypothetical protein